MMMIKKGFAIGFGTFLILIALLLGACGGPDRTKEPPAQTEAKPRVTVPDFNPDSAYQYVKTQVDFGPRVPNTPAHSKCSAYLISLLKRFTPEVTVQQGRVYAYNKNLLNFKNIIASWNPDNPDRILLCAHWDSRPYADFDPDPANHKKPIDGANDGASGVGVLLEIARTLSLKNPNIGVDLILFDAEDYGPPQDHTLSGSTDAYWGLGSQYWANNPHKPDYKAKYGILLDMVGAKNATFLMEGVSVQFAGDIVRQVWNTGNRLGYSSYFLYEQGGNITDDHIPINTIRNIPTIDIIHLDKNSETGFYPYWHTIRDNLESIDKNTLKAVGQTLLTVIFEEG